MFPLIGSLLISVAGHLLGKSVGNAWDARAKGEAAAAGTAQSGQKAFSSTLAQETQRFAQAPAVTAVDVSGGPGLPPAKADFGAIRQLLADRFEAP